MRLLILHLSDIHITEGSDPILQRATLIAQSIKDFDATLHGIVIAISGDIAFAGSQRQYDLASKWIDQLTDAIQRSARHVPVFKVVIPGNHDCDFSEPQPARAALLEAMQTTPSIMHDPATATACLGAQRAFIAFRDAVAPPNRKDTDLYYEYALPVGASKVLVRCLNSAWVSQRHERIGTLLFPHDLVLDDDDAAELVISMVHHPYNWFAAMNARELRRRLQKVSDIILTGHEHEFAAREQEDEAGGASLYVEGVALQELRDARQSGFNALIVDSASKEYRLVPFVFDGKRYQQERGAMASWRAFTANPLRQGHVFRVSASMREYLDDPGISVHHPQRGALKLQDVFVYPDLREIRFAPGIATPRMVRGERLIDVVVSVDRLLVTGPQEGGKTTLAKQLFLDALDRGLVPLLIDGATVRLKGDERDRKELSNLFEEQYDAKSAEYLDLDRASKVILLDNYSQLNAPRNRLTAALDYLAHFAEHVVLFADELAHHVNDIAGATPRAQGRAPFEHYQLMPLSHVRREELITRFVNLAAWDDHEKSEELRADMRKILNTAIGNYYAPPLPISVVSLLQARAFNDRLNLSHSAYGYYYELLITRDLAQHSSPQELDVRMGYLSALGYALFLDGRKEWDYEWFGAFHKAFTAERKLRFKLRDALDTLVAAGIIQEQGDHLSFRYAYMFYYFVARSLAERIASPEGKGHVRELTAKLHEQDAANILLFVSHLSKESAIIDPMLAKADELFGHVAPATLTVEETRISELDEALRNVVHEDKPIERARQEFLAQRDAAEGDSGVVVTSKDEVQQFLENAAEAYRTMQILGQVLKNFPGTLTGEQKERITRAVYNLGLRTLAAIHRFLADRKEAFVGETVRALKYEHPDMSTKDLMADALDLTHWYFYLTAYNLTQRIANDVGTPLLQPVFDEIEEEEMVPAVRLISTALRLDRANAFPEERLLDLSQEFARNPLAFRVLRALVLTHFHLFDDVPREVVQRVCAKLQIEYRIQAPQRLSRTRLIDKGPK